jgi:quercetin dioxygenase-like cupin family protein
MTISRMLASVALANAAFVFITTAASAQDAGARLPDYAKTPTELSAVQPTGGAGGSGNAKVQVVTILGDASKPGVYAQLLKVGSGAQIPAHHHQGDRVGTVLKGTWHFGFGGKFDKTKLKTLPVGSVYTEPTNEPHFAMTGNEPVVVLITGTGPTDTIYENPSDDPMRKP